ncbi:hypothetical protein NMG60_11007868 [Bertholletia excelsa]
MDSGHRGRTDDPFLLSYNAKDLRIASEFLSNWLPFLSRGLCPSCVQTLSDRVRSIDPVDGEGERRSRQEYNLTVSALDNLDLSGFNSNHDGCDRNSLGSWKEAGDVCDIVDVNSVGSGLSQPVMEASTRVHSPRVGMSWADMAQEDELEGEEENEVSKPSDDGHTRSGEETVAVKVQQKPELSRDQREYIRFSNVERKKDFKCYERVKGKRVNILEGLELHAGVFSAAEQKRIVDYVYKLEEMGKRGELKERTYTAPQKWMRGKGRVTIQFGCCYNYATDKHGNPPGILQNEVVDPIPHLFKVMIRRLVGWHVLPPSCVPDSCIVNIYDEGDCIPPHIDNHDFVRPFCTVSFLSECNIVFGSNLKAVGAGEFSGSVAIPLPVGSVLVLNGNGADVAKHCVPAVPNKRISITFRKMDEPKRPAGFVPEPDLQGLQPLPYEIDRAKSSTPKSNLPGGQLPVRRENEYKARGSAGRVRNYSEPRFQTRRGPPNQPRVRMNFDS